MTRFDVLDFLNKLIKTSFTENTEIKNVLANFDTDYVGDATKVDIHIEFRKGEAIN